MLFFFEAGFFALAIVTIVLGEVAGRGYALTLWAVVAAGSTLAGPIVQRRLARRPPADQTEAKWRRAVAESWRHLNRLLLLGMVAVAGWWWLGTVWGGR